MEREDCSESSLEEDSTRRIRAVCEDACVEGASNGEKEPGGRVLPVPD